jgi:hypothetical protein
MGMTIARAIPGSRGNNREGGSGTKTARNADPSAGDELQRALENLAPLALAGIKPGDVLAVTSTIGADPSRLTAVTLIGGVNNVINALQNAEGRRNSLSLDMGLPAGVLDSGALRP